MSEFVVVGAGLGGSLMAALLGRAGHRVVVVERRPDPRLGQREAGRSINLALSARGLHALERVGLAEDVLRVSTALRGRMVHPIAGPLVFQPYGLPGQAIHSVSRSALNEILLHASERSGDVALHFGRRCIGLDLASGSVSTVDAEEATPTRHTGIIIGADGASSVVRAELVRQSLTEATLEPLAHGYKELRLPAGPGGAFRLEPHALHIWPRGGYMMMAMANLDGSFTVTLYLAHQGLNSFADLATPEALDRFFERTFPDALPLLPGLRTDFFGNPTGTLTTIRSRPWHVGGGVALLGDAAHAIVPFFGQGANASFEDCVALDGTLARHPGNSERAFQEYERERRPNSNAIADLALQNFIEMRDRVASPSFRLEKRLEGMMHRLFPRWFVPLYTMISFTTIPYAAARRRAIWQRWIMRGVVVLLVLGLLAASISLIPDT